MEYTDEQLNYFRICYVVTDILAEGLRSIFKQEWDKRYKATFGEWKDEPRNGLDFWNGESPQNLTRNAEMLATMVNGNRAEWDCTMLFYAIRFSDCIHSLRPRVRSNMDDLRTFRNVEFAHMPQGHLSDVEFQNAIRKVHAAFQALGLSTLSIQEIRDQTSFPTEELRGVLKKVDDLKQKLREKEEQRQVLEDQLQSDISPFCILPPKPSHDVASRHREVAEITQQLKELKSANENNLSYFYISGNPGSGKSQLAGLVAKRFFDEIKEIPSTAATSFVMTLNAESPETLLESYVSFARHLKCPEYTVTNTVNSKDLKTDEKITNMKTLISTKIELYTSWLLVVDNVTNTYRVHGHLPESGNEQWVRGQLLITTQDTVSIPLTSSFIQHISVCKGMEPQDASSLLAKLSGIVNSEIEKEVAQALDYQPLALASAATYVRQVRQNKATSNFGWNDYLKKLDAGQRGTTETILAETNPSYPNTMTAATTLAVEKQMTSDKVIDHTFRFLYLCAPQPLSLDIVINYILNVDEEIKDKEMIIMRIQRCSLLLFEEEETGVYIRVHQVVHDVINVVITDLPEIQRLRVVNGAVRSFTQFIDENLSEDWHDVDSLINSKHIVPHLTTLIVKIEHLCSKQNISQVIQSGIFNIQCCSSNFQNLGQICRSHGEFYPAKKYFYKALEFLRRSEAYNDLDEADAYVGIGKVHGSLGDLEQAKTYFERARDIFLKTLGPLHIDVAATFDSLGTVHRNLGDLQQAKEYYDRALAISLETLEPEHVDVARTNSNLGTVHNVLGDLKAAKECYDRALAIFLKKLGPEHADVARTYNNLGSLHGDLGDLQQAQKYHDRVLAIRLKMLGPEHVDVARTYNNLGTVHSNLRNLQQAKEYYDRALAIFLKKLGPEHVDVATTYNSLGTVHIRLGELQQAKEHYDRALAIFQKRFGPKHVDVARAYNNLGTVHSHLGELLQAKEYHERALAILLKTFGPEHVDVTTVQRNIINLKQRIQAIAVVMCTLFERRNSTFF